jgi:3-phenylpropionate/trans-cinnamate dioxygenase ferredoxin component
MKQYAIDLETLKKEIKHRVVFDQTAILLILKGDHVYAISDRCPHMGASLLHGEIDNDTIECPKHHAKIDFTSGKVIDRAKILFVKFPTKDTISYPTEIKDGKVYVDL